MTSEAAEQQTQMLFAQTCDIIEEKSRWKRIKLHNDGQEGWADAKMISPLSEEEYVSVVNADRKALVRLPMTSAVSANNGQTLPLTAGVCLPDYSDGEFEILGVRFYIDKQAVIDKPLKMSSETLMEATRFFLNTPYLWGGKNALGMDCSGFTQVIMSLFGVSLPRNASEQALEGQSVALKNAKAGDLVFFDHADITPENTRISHVGILLNSNTVIHCSGRVKVERVDDQGVFSVEIRDFEHPEGQYTHHLASIRRLDFDKATFLQKRV